MYLAIDVGGSKTLLAVLSETGKIVYQLKFPTEKTYEHFISKLKNSIEDNVKSYDIKYCCCAAPGTIHRASGVAMRFGNLKWKNAPLKHDISKILGGDVPVVVENDAKLAGLAEALAVQKKYKKVLYMTISTGIGDGIIIDGKIDSNFADSEPGHMILEHEGKLVKWEDLASGRALVERYGMKASEITDQKIWREFSKLLTLGLHPLIAVLQPDVVIIGGGVGAHFKKFEPYLNSELNKMKNPLVNIPPILQAKNPEEAVVYGCYEFIRQQR